MVTRRVRSIPLVALPIALVLVAFAALYAWSASTGAGFDRPTADQYAPADPYNLLAEALSHGRLALEIEAPKELLALPDPYDDKRNGQFREGGLHDVSLYDGRLYSYWGPAPALLLYVPLRAVGVDYIHPGVAALLFALVGLGFLIACFLLIARRLLPATPPWVLVLGAAALAAGNLMPYVLARAFVYEVVIAAAFCFVAAGAWCLSREWLSERPRLGGYAAASALFGLAFASRPTAGVTGVLLLLALLAYRRSDRQALVRAGAALLGPFTVLVLLQFAYNAARFDGPLEFGATYSLTGPSQRYMDFNSFSYIPAGMWQYMVAPPVPRLQFPFLWFPPPPDFPGSAPSHYVFGPVAGIVPSQPLLLLLVAFPFLAGVRGRLRQVVGAGVAVGLLIALLLSWTLWFASQRYAADFAVFLILAAVLAWASMSTIARTGLRRLALGAGAALACFGIAVSAASIVHRIDNPLISRDPEQYRSLERFFSPVPTLAATVAGGPMLAAINDDPYGSGPRWSQVSLEGSDVYVQSGTKLTIVSRRTQVARLTGTLEVLDPGWPDGTTGSLVADANGRVETALVDGRPAAIAVQLRRGLNSVELSISREPVVAPELQATQTPVRLRDVQLEP